MVFHSKLYRPKYLGVTLDSQLKYDKHVNKTVATASLKLKQLRRMRSFLNTKAATLVYKNMILPIVEYGDCRIWRVLMGASLADKKKLQVLQNKGLRCALNADKYADTDELHSAAELLKLKYRRETHLLNLMFDKAGVPGNLKCQRSTGMSTRSSVKKLLKIRRPRTEKYKKSLSYAGPRIWNALPSNIQQAESRADFKCKIRAHMEIKSLGASKVNLLDAT